MIYVLQSCNMAYDDVTEDNVYTCVGHPLRSDIENIVTWMLNESFKKAYDSILLCNFSLLKYLVDNVVLRVQTLKSSAILNQFDRMDKILH